MSLVENAKKLGFKVLTEPPVGINPKFANLLPTDSDALVLSTTRSTAEVLVDYIPSAVQIAAFEQSLGLQVNVVITEPEILIQAMDSVAKGVTKNTPDVAILTRILQSHRNFTSLTLVVGQPALLTAPEKSQTTEEHLYSFEDLVDIASEIVGNSKVDEIVRGTRNVKESITYSMGEERFKAKVFLSPWETGKAAISLQKAPSVFNPEMLGTPKELIAVGMQPAQITLVGSPPVAGKSSTLAALVTSLLESKPGVCVWLSKLNELPYGVQDNSVVVHMPIQNSLDLKESLINLSVYNPSAVVVDVENHVLDAHALKTVKALAAGGCNVFLSVTAWSFQDTLETITEMHPGFLPDQVCHQFLLPDEEGDLSALYTLITDGLILNNLSKSDNFQVVYAAAVQSCAEENLNNSIIAAEYTVANMVMSGKIAFNTAYRSPVGKSPLFAQQIRKTELDNAELDMIPSSYIETAKVLSSSTDTFVNPTPPVNEQKTKRFRRKK